MVEREEYLMESSQKRLLIWARLFTLKNSKLKGDLISFQPLLNVFRLTSLIFSVPFKLLKYILYDKLASRDALLIH